MNALELIQATVEPQQNHHEDPWVTAGLKAGYEIGAEHRRAYVCMNKNEVLVEFHLNPGAKRNSIKIFWAHSISPDHMFDTKDLTTRDSPWLTPKGFEKALRIMGTQCSPERRPADVIDEMYESGSVRQ